jgi:hypothetical protein
MIRETLSKSKYKRPNGRRRRRCWDGIKNNLKEMRWEGMDWVHLT